MIKIILEMADNGVVKTITDDNSNGAGSLLEQKIVYDFEKDHRHNRKMQFFFDISNDLGIDTGNKFNKNNLVMASDWGPHYEPSAKDIDKKISKLELEIEALKMLKEEGSIDESE
jgi:hypothetical protein